MASAAPRELRLLRAQARAHALERALALVERGGLARAALKIQALQQPLVRLALVLARILERGGGLLLRLHGGRARAVGRPVHLRLIVDAVRVLRAVAAQELPERGGGLLRALFAASGNDQQHDGQHRKRDGRIIQRLRHKITQRRAQRGQHERRDPEIRLAAVLRRPGEGLGPLRVALGGLARLVRRLHTEVRLLERGAPVRSVPPGLLERLLERAQVRFFLAHAAQRRAALPLPGGVHLLGHGLQLRVRLRDLGSAGRLLLRVALEPVQLLFHRRDAPLQLRQRAVLARCAGGAATRAAARRPRCRSLPPRRRSRWRRCAFPAPGVPVTTRPPCPMNAVRANTSADTPVSRSPASAAVRPGTGMSVPVYTAEKPRSGAFGASVQRRIVMHLPPCSSSSSPAMGLPLQGAYFCLSGTNPARARWDVSIP